MWGIPVDRSKPMTTLTIRAMSKEECDGRRKGHDGGVSR
jgi:hypothetical protein